MKIISNFGIKSQFFQTIRTIILVLAGMVTALLIGAVGAPTMTTTQTAEAKVDNCKVEEDGDFTCSGGEGDAGGGSGRHSECDSGGNYFISGGGGGRGCGESTCIVGGQGANLFCSDDPFPEDCDPGPGGSGVHVQGVGGNRPE